MIGAEVEGITRRVGFIRSVRVANAVAPRVLASKREAVVEAAINGRLQGVVMVSSAAGLVVDLRKSAAELPDGRFRRQ